VIDPVLEQDIKNMHALQDYWKKYYDMIVYAISSNEISPEKEREFMQIKSNIAMLHDEFHQLVPEDEAQTSQLMMDLISRTISLRNIRLLSPAEIKKFEIEWHEANFLLNNVIGDLEDKRERVAKISAFSYYFKQFLQKLISFIIGIYENPFVRFAVVIVILYFAICGIDTFFGDKLVNIKGYQWLRENIISKINIFGGS